MDELLCYQVPYFILSNEFKENDIKCGRFSYYMEGGDSEAHHKRLVKNRIDCLIEKNHDHYAEWRNTDIITKNIGGAVGWISICHFRIKDSY